MVVSVCHYLLPVPSHPPYLPPNFKSSFFVVINNLLSSTSNVYVLLGGIKAMPVKMPAWATQVLLLSVSNWWMLRRGVPLCFGDMATGRLSSFTS